LLTSMGEYREENRGGKTLLLLNIALKYIERDHRHWQNQPQRVALSMADPASESACRGDEGCLPPRSEWQPPGGGERLRSSIVHKSAGGQC
jgi:hypothetical protein